MQESATDANSRAPRAPAQSGIASSSGTTITFTINCLTFKLRQPASLNYRPFANGGVAAKHKASPPSRFGRIGQFTSCGDGPGFFARRVAAN
jgi:hypothetical protein